MNDCSSKIYLYLIFLFTTKVKPIGLTSVISDDHLWVLFNITILSTFVSAWCAHLLGWYLEWTTHVSVWVDAFPWLWGSWVTDLLAFILWYSWVLACDGSWQADTSVVSEWEACTGGSVVALPWLV